MPLKEESNGGRTPPLNVFAGLVAITAGLYLMFAEYLSAPLPDWSTSWMLMIIGVIGITAYYTTRPEGVILKIACVCLFLGLFFKLRPLLREAAICSGGCWPMYLIVFGAGLLLSHILSHGKTKQLMVSFFLLALGAVFLLQSNQILGGGVRSWIATLTIMMIMAGIYYVFKAFASRNEDGS